MQVGLYCRLVHSCCAVNERSTATCAVWHAQDVQCALRFHTAPVSASSSFQAVCSAVSSDTSSVMSPMSSRKRSDSSGSLLYVCSTCREQDTVF